MMTQFRWHFLVLIGVMGLPAGQVIAQRGNLIEDLFRTVAEAQLERQERQRADAQKRPQQRPRQQPQQRANDRRPQAINVGSKEMATFAGSLSSFAREIGFLVTDLQAFAATAPHVRSVLPPTYQVSSDVQTLLHRCHGLAHFDPIMDDYAAMDAAWRSLSFELQAITGPTGKQGLASKQGLTDEMMTHVRACDQWIGKMGQQLGVSPQMDRHALHDKMIVAATYLQSLLDDLQISHLPTDKIRQWTHDGRVLRQELLRTSGEVEHISYQDLSSQFTEFVTRWHHYSGPIHAVGDPHLTQRLDRVSQCGEETYALLWRQPPVSAVDLTASMAQLKQLTSELMDQLTLRTLAALDHDTRDQVDDLTRHMYHHASELNELASGKLASGSGDPSKMRGPFSGFDEDWLSLRETLLQMPRVDRGVIAAIDRQCESLRRVLRVTPAGPSSVRYDELVGIAASLEGASEYFKADIDRHHRHLKPASFRRSISDAADDFHRSSQRLHAKLDDQEDFRSLSRETKKLVEAWQRLSADVARLRTSGLTGSRAANLERASQRFGTAGCQDRCRAASAVMLSV